MNRRAFIALLTAPMIVRATSLDALPRGVPLYGNPHVDSIRTLHLRNRTIHLTAPLDLRAYDEVVIDSCRIYADGFPMFDGGIPMQHGNLSITNNYFEQSGLLATAPMIVRGGA